MTRPQVLFVCVHNAGRSQMAAAFLHQIAGRRVSVRSGGSIPATAINPMARAAMLEVGIDLASAVPTKLSEAEVERSDYVVTMGCGDACPFYPGRVYLDWALRDPADQPLEVVREIRDEIRTRERWKAAEVSDETRKED